MTGLPAGTSHAPAPGLSAPGPDRGGTSHGNSGTAGSRVATWPLLALALPAVVAIWSGWVGLGGMCGFGPVDLLPGIGRGAHLNTAITLPVGMEVYAAYALRAWLAGDVPARARVFARRSALVALALGAAGQVAYHLMTAAHWKAAPWPVTIAVSCVPVAVLGMGAALAHLLGEPAGEPVVEPARPGLVQVPLNQAEPVVEPGPEPGSDPAREPAVEPPREPAAQAGSTAPEPAREPELEPAGEPVAGSAPEPFPPAAAEVVERPRLAVVPPAPAARRVARKGPVKSSDPRVGLRVACGCGCGQDVSRMTKDRHEERVRQLASRASQNGHREPVSAR
jgi:hypothetical protein